AASALLLNTHRGQRTSYPRASLTPLATKRHAAAELTRVETTGRSARHIPGRPRTVFRRALEHGNLLVPEATVPQDGRLDLGEALELTALIALDDRYRSRRAAMP